MSALGAEAAVADGENGDSVNPAIEHTQRGGPLVGLKVLELGGIGPAPYACMLLADAGADVLRVSRFDATDEEAEHESKELLLRGRVTLAVDLKDSSGRQLVCDLASRADALVEGFRPGVAERLGLGPSECLVANPRLVYGRMTGWGQNGPWAQRAGHDINYISIAGALWPMGRPNEVPVPPLNLVGDFGGGGMMLAFGILAALWEVNRSGRGQVIDAAMVDGSASLLTMLHSHWHLGEWIEKRGSNRLDSGAHFYEVYETADGAYFSVGAVEPKFYSALLEGLDLKEADLPAQTDRDSWPKMKELFASIFATKTRDEWTDVFAHLDACTSPVLSPSEAHRHPHNKERGIYVEVDGVTQPGPVPLFSRTPSSLVAPSKGSSEVVDERLRGWGLDDQKISELRGSGAVRK